MNYDLANESVGKLDTRQSSGVDKEASTWSDFPHKVSNNGAKIRQSWEHATMSFQFNFKNTLKLIRNNKSEQSNCTKVLNVSDLTFPWSVRESTAVTFLTHFSNKGIFRVGDNNRRRLEWLSIFRSHWIVSRKKLLKLVSMNFYDSRWLKFIN